MFEDEGTTNQINTIRSSTQFSDYNNSKQISNSNYQSCEFESEGSNSSGSKRINSLSNSENNKYFEQTNYGIQLNFSQIDEEDGEDDSADIVDDQDDSNVLSFDIEEYARTDFINFQDLGATKSLQESI